MLPALLHQKVCVSGGGIAGLTAAYELCIRGHGVTLLEASDRFGGRIMTHRFPDGTYGELGAMRIPITHGCVSHYVDKFRVKKRTFVSQNANSYLYLRGKRSRISGLADPMEYKFLRNQYNLDLYGQDYILSNFSPLDSLDKLFEQVSIPLGRKELELMFKHFEIPPQLQPFEQASMGQVLRGQPVIHNGVSLSHEGFEYVGRANGILWFEQTSCLQWIINELALYEQQKYELEGGMEKLCDAFIEQISERVQENTTKSLLIKNAPVYELRHKGGKVEVLWRSGERTSNEAFDYVICTAPAGATVRITFDPPMPAEQYEALTNLTYASAGKTLIHCSERFWELNDGIIGGGSYSDLPHQQCWYPSDNSKEANGTRFKYGLIRDEAQAIDWTVNAVQKSKQPAVFTAAYMWGPNADRFAALQNDDLQSMLILSSVAKVHPNIRAYVKDVDVDVVHYAWNSQSSPGSGAFAFFAPGEQSRYQKALCDPHFRDFDGIPRLFFAGEHLAIAHAWIQSAVQTALSAVFHVVNSP